MTVLIGSTKKIETKIGKLHGLNIFLTIFTVQLHPAVRSDMIMQGQYCLVFLLLVALVTGETRPNILFILAGNYISLHKKTIVTFYYR